MRTIYIDSEFKCHVADNGSMTSVTTDFFDGKCDNFTEGFRMVPPGESWRREDGRIFYGEMISPWVDYRILQAYQDQYEKTEIPSEIVEKATAYDIIMEGVPL